MKAIRIMSTSAKKTVTGFRKRVKSFGLGVAIQLLSKITFRLASIAREPEER
jgi:hypothetical protein